MRKYGVENATNNFISFNTICDATQVKSLLLHLFHYFPHKLSFDILVKLFLGLKGLILPIYLYVEGFLLLSTRPKYFFSNTC